MSASITEFTSDWRITEKQKTAINNMAKYMSKSDASWVIDICKMIYQRNQERKEYRSNSRIDAIPNTEV